MAEATPAKDGDTGARDDSKEDKESKKAELSEAEKLVRKILFFKNPFDQLGVKPETSNDDVRKAFRRLALKVHPDRCRCEGATEATMALSKALAIVQDSEKRKPYVELMTRAHRTVSEAWQRAGRQWRTRVSPPPQQGQSGSSGACDDDDDDEAVWKEDEEFVLEVQRAVHTMILMVEVREAAQKRVAKVEEELAKAEQAKEEQRCKQEAEREHRWAKQRDLRVNDWRAFQKQQKHQPAAKRARTGMAKPIKPPPIVREQRPQTPQDSRPRCF